MRRVALVGALARFFFEALTAIPGITRAGRRVASRVLLQQVWFTALQAIVLVVLAFNLVGDGLRDAFDPRQGQGASP